MVAALTLALAVGSYPPPVAAFSAPAVVRVGAQVTYVDHSYDPAPGHSIVLQIWTGRAPVFYQTGAHTVSLAVEDDRGQWGQTSRTILVVSSPPPPPPPRIATATLTAAPSAVYRGDAVELTLSAPASATSIRLGLPPAFTAPVPLPTGVIDYPAINGEPWTFRAGTWHTRIWIPWTADSPANGSYIIVAHFLYGGRASEARATLTIDGTDRLALWRMP